MQNDSDLTLKIKQYWDDRSRENCGSVAATTNDIHLRDLEIETIIRTLHEVQMPPDACILDVGCGDGYSTLKVAEAMPGVRFVGVDYSENMIQAACDRLRLRPDMEGRVLYRSGDATDLDHSCGDFLYDAVLSDRCLINLPSLESQARAIAQIARHTGPGGYYIAIENFMEGQDNMNEARRAVGLPEIPVRWHNRFFKEAEFIASSQPFFENTTFKNFSSSYYFATRVIYSEMCRMRGEEPDYNHEIHRLAVRLPWVGNFSPIRMAVLRRNPAMCLSNTAPGI